METTTPLQQFRTKLASKLRNITKQLPSGTRAAETLTMSEGPRLTHRAGKIAPIDTQDLFRKGIRFIEAAAKSDWKISPIHIFIREAQALPNGSTKLLYRIGVTVAKDEMIKNAGAPVSLVYQAGEFSFGPSPFKDMDLKTAFRHLARGEPAPMRIPAPRKAAGIKNVDLRKVSAQVTPGSSPNPFPKAPPQLEAVWQELNDLKAQRNQVQAEVDKMVAAATELAQLGAGKDLPNLNAQIQSKHKIVVDLLQQLDTDVVQLTNTSFVVLAKTNYETASYKDFAKFLTNFSKRLSKWFNVALAPFRTMRVNLEAVPAMTTDDIGKVRDKTDETNREVGDFTTLRQRGEERYKDKPYFKPKVDPKSKTPFNKTVVTGQLEQDSTQQLTQVNTSLDSLIASLQTFVSGFKAQVESAIELGQQSISSEGLPEPVTAGKKSHCTTCGRIIDDGHCLECDRDDEDRRSREEDEKTREGARKDPEFAKHWSGLDTAERRGFHRVAKKKVVASDAVAPQIVQALQSSGLPAGPAPEHMASKSLDRTAQLIQEGWSEEEAAQHIAQNPLDQKELDATA